jgi:G:T-mismatch repair DNA endonuclease (very short patch repair protein)
MSDAPRQSAIGNPESRIKNPSLRTGRTFWAGKLAANMARDRFVNRTLRKQGWHVVRIWEHELGEGRKAESGKPRAKVVERIRRALG